MEVWEIDIIISNSNGQPIYEQICSQIKGHIVSGKIKSGDILPSIRALAKDLRISVITTKRAYEELEKSGYIISVPGKGSFVAEKNLELVKEENLRRIEEHMEEIVRLAAACNLSYEELLEMFQLFMEGGNNI